MSGRGTTSARVRRQWDVYDIRSGSTAKQGHYFTLTAISRDTSDDDGAQPVTVKASGKHVGVLACMTCKLPTCEHMKFVADYIERHGGTAAEAMRLFQQERAWMTDEAAWARNNGTPF